MARKNQDGTYKQLRNLCTKMIKKVKINNTKNKLEANPDEIWKTYRNINNGKDTSSMSLEEDGKIITNSEEIANIMNSNFKDKIVKTKGSLNNCEEEDPLVIMTSHKNGKTCCFALRTITVREAKISLRTLKPKPHLAKVKYLKN